MRQSIAKLINLACLMGIQTMLHIGVRFWVTRYWVGDIGEVVKSESSGFMQRLAWLICAVALLVAGCSTGSDCGRLDSSDDPGCKQMYEDFRKDYYENYEPVP